MNMLTQCLSHTPLSLSLAREIGISFGPLKVEQMDGGEQRQHASETECGSERQQKRERKRDRARVLAERARARNRKREIVRVCVCLRAR